MIADGYVVCQVFNDGSGITAPITRVPFPTLQEAADWLIAFYTRDGETEPLPQYDPMVYCVEEWLDGAVENRWQVEADGSTTEL